MPTIKDVAAAAGVSIGTVSCALSGKRPVAPATRRRIEEAIAQLGYQPHAGARMLAAGRTHILAVSEPLSAEHHASSHMAFIHACTIAARKREHDVLLLADTDASAGMRRVARSDLVDAVLVLDVAPDDERVPIARSIGVPSVFIGIPDDHEGLTCVDLDFEAAGRIAATRVIDAGHRHLALLGHPEIAFRRWNSAPRVRRGLEAAAQERDATSAFFFSGEADVETSTVAAAVSDALLDGATALVLHGPPELEPAVLAELRRMGVALGTDVAVVSIGSLLRTGTAPAVDTIPLVPSASCDLAVMLAAPSEGEAKAAPGVHLVEPTYIDVGSVSPAPTD